MPVLVTDPDLEKRLIAARQEADSDRFDEVWDGLYIMAPLANDEHQDIQISFAAALKIALGWDSPAKVRPGVNVSDRAEDWINNYRCPDVVVYLPGNPAINHGTHWRRNGLADGIGGSLGYGFNRDGFIESVRPAGIENAVRNDS